MEEREMGKHELIKTKVEICKIKKGFLKKKGNAGECQNTSTSTRPSLAVPRTSKLATPERSPNVKAGFLDVPALPEGSQGRDFLLEQAPLPPEERALDPGSSASPCAHPR